MTNILQFNLFYKKENIRVHCVVINISSSKKTLGLVEVRYPMSQYLRCILF